MTNFYRDHQLAAKGAAKAMDSLEQAALSLRFREVPEHIAEAVGKAHELVRDYVRSPRVQYSLFTASVEDGSIIDVWPAHICKADIKAGLLRSFGSVLGSDEAIDRWLHSIKRP